MRKKIGLMLLIAILAMSFTACGGGEVKTDGQTPESGNTGLEWPSQYMSTLPAPDSMISSIEKLNGTETIAEDDMATQPSSVNVVMNEMTKEEASSYYDKLKSAGFTINTDQKDNDMILLVGTLNDADSNPFLFRYTAADQFGNVSITIMKAVGAGGASDVAAGSEANSSDASAASEETSSDVAAAAASETSSPGN